MSNHKPQARQVLSEREKNAYAEQLATKANTAPSLVARVWGKVKGWARRLISGTKRAGQHGWSGICWTGRAGAWTLYHAGQGVQRGAHLLFTGVRYVLAGVAITISVVAMAIYTSAVYVLSIVLRLIGLGALAVSLPHLTVRSRQEKEHLSRKSWDEYRDSLRPSNLHIFPGEMNREMAARPERAQGGRKTGPTPKQARRRPARPPVVQPRTA